LSQATITPVSGEGPRIAALQPAEVYADRPYEKRLTETGRRFISVDVDARLLDQLDRARGKDRRGVFLDKLLATLLVGQGELQLNMP
jgi:hypothetical protein